MTTSTAGFFSTGCMPTGMPRPSSVDPDPAVVLQHHLDARGVAGHRLVDGVVHDLPDQVVQAALAGGADVHAGPLAHRLQSLEDRDRRRAVGVLLVLRSHGQPVSSRKRTPSQAAAARVGRAGCDPSGSPAPAHPSILLVRADRSAGRTPPAAPLPAERDRNRDTTAEKGVQAGPAGVTARCTAVCPVHRATPLSDRRRPGSRSAVGVARAPAADGVAVRAASSGRWARPPGSAAPRPCRPRPRAGRAGRAAACAAASPTPSTPPAAPAPRRAATAACSGRRCRSRRAGASDRGRSRRSAGATSRGPARRGRRAGPAAAGRGRPDRAPTSAAAGSSAGGPRPTARRTVRRREPPRFPAPRAAPPEQDQLLGARCSPDRSRRTGLPSPTNGHRRDQRSASRRPQPWGQLHCCHPRRTVAAHRWTVVRAAHHQSSGSYPQYPQPCPQPGSIMPEALTSCSVEATASRGRSGRHSPQSAIR